MAIQSQDQNYHQKWNFRVEIDGLAIAHFTKAGPMTVQIGKQEVNEGGRMIPVKAATTVTFPVLTLEAGVTTNSDFYNWVKETADAITNRGEPSGRYKKNFAIVELDRDGSALVRNTFYGGFPVEAVLGDWDGSAKTEATMHSIQIEYDKFEKTVVAA